MPSTDSDTNDYGTGFLGDLQPSIKRYSYKGKQQFASTLNKEFNGKASDSIENMSEWVLFTGIDEETFVQDFLNSADETDEWTENWTSFDSSHNLLLIRIPLSPHEVAADTFKKLLLFALQPMGLENALQRLSRTDTEGPSGRKQADGSWAPRRVPIGRSRNWPSVVLEVALSEAQSKLSSDVRYWLHQSQGDVKIALTLTINRQKPEIILEKWELQNDRQHRTQRVKISMGANKRITVSDGPLVIDFEKLFLRPSETPEKTDTEIDTDMLKELATMIWEQQGFVEMGAEWS